MSLFDIQLTFVTLYCTFGLRLCSGSEIGRSPFDGAGWHSLDRSERWLEESHQIQDQGQWFSFEARDSLYKEIPIYIKTSPYGYPADVTRIWWVVTANFLSLARRLLLFSHT
jgi:hypothetical protein